MNKLLVILPSPIPKLQHTPLPPPKCCEPRSMPQLDSFVVFTLDSHLSLSRSLGARQIKSFDSRIVHRVHVKIHKYKRWNYIIPY
jgi:hypothetical protein